MTAAAGPLAQPLRQGASPRQRSGGEWTGVDRSHGFEQFGRQLDRDRRHPRRGGHHRNAGRNGAARARSGKQCQRCGPGRRAAHRPTAVLHAEKPAGEHEAHGDQRSETTRAGRPRAPWRANSAPEFPPGRRARSRDLGRRRTTRRRSTQPVAAGQHRISIRTSCRPCSACCWPATHRPGYPPQLPRRCGARSDRWVRPNGSANRSLAAWRPGGRDPVSGRPAQEQREGDRRTRQGLGQHTHPDRGHGAVIAGRLIGRTGRPSSAAYATYTGAASVEVASADKARHRLSRAGDRQLNSALHTIAVTQLVPHQTDYHIIDVFSSSCDTPRDRLGIQD